MDALLGYALKVILAVLIGAFVGALCAVCAGRFRVGKPNGSEAHIWSVGHLSSEARATLMFGGRLRVSVGVYYASTNNFHPLTPDVEAVGHVDTNSVGDVQVILDEPMRMQVLPELLSKFALCDLDALYYAVYLPSGKIWSVVGPTELEKDWIGLFPGYGFEFQSGSRLLVHSSMKQLEACNGTDTREAS